MDSETPFPSPQDFLIIAHRGASSYAPENTIAAFDLALQMGERHLELDVHLTRDDHLVVIHDDTVDARRTVRVQWQARHLPHSRRLTPVPGLGKPLQDLASPRSLTC